MKKFIEAPDFHFDKRWSDISMQCAKSIEKTAIENKVDAILFPGDFWNRPLIASDDGGVNCAREIIKMLSKICPVLAVEGTPSHDAPGSYGPLEDCGLYLLRPGRAYQLIVDGVVFYGIPEISKETILSIGSFSGQQANAEAENLIENYILEFVAPSRMLYSDKVAIGLLHGNVVDSHRENLTDVILKASDILIRTESLAPSNIDRWSIGHIHTPWESKKISAGYAGFTGVDDNPYGKLGFKPSMNMITIEKPGSKPEIERMPYGTPIRVKIETPLESYDKNIAYWLDTDDMSAERPSGHEWSKITRKKPVKIEKTLDIKSGMTLPEIFKAYDSNVSPEIIKKVESLSLVASDFVQSIDVKIVSVEIDGCIFWKNRKIKFDIESINSGVNRLSGRMGDGKSALLGFCTPYPVITGKDTESGRSSAIKEFFDTNDAYIEKILTLNGVSHRHLLTIKKTKTECYLYIGDENQLETTSFDEMMQKCESLYGPYSDYLLTTFYVQPLQSSQGPGLMAAKKVDARNVVQGISGVNREKELRYSLDKKNELSKLKDEKSAWISGAIEFLDDKNLIESMISESTESLASIEEKIRQTSILGKDAKEFLDNASIEFERSKKESEKYSANYTRINSIRKMALELNDVSNSLNDNKNKLLEIEKYNASKIGDYSLKNSYENELNKWNQLLLSMRSAVETSNSEKRKKLDKYKSDLYNYNLSKSGLEAIINNPIACEKCGYIADELPIIDAKKKLSELFIPIDPSITIEIIPDSPGYSKPIEPIYQNIEEPPFLEADIRNKIQAGETAKSKIADLENELNDLSKIEYSINDDSERLFNESKAKYEELRDLYSSLASDKKISENNLIVLREKLSLIDSQLSKISIAKNELESIEIDLLDWSYIAKSLSPANIPALELEMSIMSIDHEASRILLPFFEGQFSVRTEAVEGFDILIYDAETGIETSFFKKNPGHKAFFSDAYTKALIKQRNDRQHRKYSPIIMDEADAPIEAESIQTYYRMQDDYFSILESKVLVVSHKGAGHIINTIDVRSLQNGDS